MFLSFSASRALQPAPAKKLESRNTRTEFQPQKPHLIYRTVQAIKAAKTLTLHISHKAIITSLFNIGNFDSPQQLFRISVPYDCFIKNFYTTVTVIFRRLSIPNLQSPDTQYTCHMI